MVSKVMYILVRGHLGLCKDVLKYIITVILFQFGSGRSAKLVVASACGFVAAFTYFLDFFCLVQARRIVRTREREYHDYAREQQNKQLRGNQLDITKESVIFQTLCLCLTGLQNVQIHNAFKTETFQLQLSIRHLMLQIAKETSLPQIYTNISSDFII